MEIEDALGVFSGTFLVSVVAAIGQHHELSVEEMLVERHALFHGKDKTPVRLNDQARARHGTKGVPEVKVIFSVSPAEQAELVE